LQELRALVSPSRWLIGKVGLFSAALGVLFALACAVMDTIRLAGQLSGEAQPYDPHAIVNVLFPADLVLILGGVLLMFVMIAGMRRRR
jgi:hypothetical protein